MVRISVQLTEKQAEWLKKEAAETGLAKTDVIRRAVDFRIEQRGIMRKDLNPLFEAAERIYSWKKEAF